MNFNNTPQSPFTNIDLSPQNQIDLIIKNGVKVPRGKIFEKFTHFDTTYPDNSYDYPDLANSSIYQMSEYVPLRKHKKNEDKDSDSLNPVIGKMKQEVLKKKQKFGEEDKDGESQYDADERQVVKDVIRLNFIDYVTDNDGKRLVIPLPTLKNKSIKNCEVILYWYFDMELLEEEYNLDDIIITADFVSDFSKYDIQPDYIVTDNTKESKFYAKIFELIREGKSSRKIKEEVSNPEDNLTISAKQINNYKKLVEID